MSNVLFCCAFFLIYFFLYFMRSYLIPTTADLVVCGKYPLSLRSDEMLTSREETFLRQHQRTLSTSKAWEEGRACWLALSHWVGVKLKGPALQLLFASFFYLCSAPGMDGFWGDGTERVSIWKIKMWMFSSGYLFI